MALDAVAKTSVFNAACQMFGRPGRVVHRNCQCFSVTACGTRLPAVLTVRVSTNRKRYISSSGALTIDSASTTGQARKFALIA